MVANRGVNPLKGTALYIPQLCQGTAQLFSGAFRAVGVDARPNPASDARTRDLAARHCSGDECYPQIVTLGNFLKVTEEPGFEPGNTAIFMPTAAGPCRFGQYNVLFRRTLDRIGLEEVDIISPSCENGYRGLGKIGPEAFRYVWWALVTGDILRKMLHRTRPYECVPGETDAVYQQCLDAVFETLSQPDRRGKAKFTDLKRCLERCRKLFANIEADYSKQRLLIGVGGEIFCRLNTYSNEDFVRKIEQYGGEAWVSDIVEWFFYSNLWEMEEIRTFGNRFSPSMLKAWLSDTVQKREEHQLYAPFREALIGWEEPSTDELVKLGGRYVDPHAVLGESILSLGKATWFHRKGADGMVDISPFSCMNAILSESIYPKVSRDLDGLPIRSFYFDGTQANLDEDVSIFMELAAHYAKGKQPRRTFPPYFD
jgi:predicted nucleotide-binding protein (sugar kinase/HSP70/actin superfamily)